ncbi:hypothetical protein QTI24_20155 [Variovorax sp. J22P240]|uniref:hypothetical protein n=1 Tax=unclassified Variovorax TaxID=663243 RepID=UPI002577E916|nr:MULTISPECIES: hypothetical protein [unclassified Variovorax]MDM0000935.1 hypothetical protein [Variovorax sp. J22P240]MDM0050126.1 hypothetical protein [Variovorax sp. J22R115]
MRVSEGMKWVTITAAAAAALGAPLPAAARPWTIYNSLRDTPIVQFKQADIDLMTKTINRALESGEDGVTVKWENPGTPNSGSVTPEKDPKGRAGCRLARIENRHGSMHNAGGYIFCRNPDKSTAKATPWKVVGPWAG